MKDTKRTTIKVNVLAQEITMANVTAKRAGIIGSDEYKQLLQATTDFPHFKVKVLSQKAKENSDKGLTIEIMTELVKVITNDNKEDIERFETIKRANKGLSSHFSKPKMYFLSLYPDWREWLLKLDERQAGQAETEIETPQEIKIEKYGMFRR